MRFHIPAGGSIGLHQHKTSSEINDVSRSVSKSLCQGEAETLTPGQCHDCPKGAAHSIANTGTEDLVLFTVVSQSKRPRPWQGRVFFLLIWTSQTSANPLAANLPPVETGDVPPAL